MRTVPAPLFRLAIISRIPTRVDYKSQAITQIHIRILGHSKIMGGQPKHEQFSLAVPPLTLDRMLIAPASISVGSCVQSMGMEILNLSATLERMNIPPSAHLTLRLRTWAVIPLWQVRRDLPLRSMVNIL